MEAVDATAPIDIVLPEARHLRRLYGTAELDRLLDTAPGAARPRRWQALADGWAAGVQDFLERRESFLLYPP
jgi:hypothetical protein